jgi:Rrf2 family protein
MLLRRDRAMTAISVMLDVAFHTGGTNTVSANDIAERIGSARRGLEPLMQALSRAGLLDSTRGPRGGYRLGRPKRDMTLADIVAAAGAEPEDVETMPSALHKAVVEPLWATLNDAVGTQLAAVTLDELLKRAAKAGLRRPESDPISYSI